MNTKINQLNADLQKAMKAASDVCDMCEKENREFTAEERSFITSALGDAANLKKQLKQLESDEAMRGQIEAFAEGAASAKSRTAEKAAKRDYFNGDIERNTIGAAFTESPEFQKWLSEVAPSGRVAEKSRVQSPAMQVKRLSRKALVTGESNTSAGAFVETDYTGLYGSLGTFPLTVADLFSQGQTTSDLVHFVRQTRESDESEAVPESNVTKYTGATGQVSGEKPEGTIAFEPVTTPVRTIAVWIPATKRALADVPFIRSIIDGSLLRDLAVEKERQLLYGNGVGENLTGIASTPHTLVQPFDTRIDITARRAVTALQVVGRTSPTAWLMNPYDWETFDLLEDNEGRYVYGGPKALGQKVLWGAPVVISHLQPQGTAWLANWKDGFVWDREQANISVTDNHSDFFIRNMIAILAEERLAFGVLRPQSFIQVDLVGGS